jgi:hypothetical protein
MVQNSDAWFQKKQSGQENAIKLGRFISKGYNFLTA